MKKLLIICLLLLLTSCSNEKSNTKLTLSFITIPKGDAFIVDIDNKYHYLVDTGKKSDWNKIDTVLKYKDINKIDGIILSHGHKDHTGSLENILDNYDVDNLYISSIDNITYQKIDVIKLASDHGVKVNKINKNDELIINDVKFKFWIPDIVDLNSENNNSLILNINHGDINYLMMGDALKDEELIYLSENPNLDVDLLKFGHHGEDNASSKPFLLSTKPSIAIKTANINANSESFNNKLDKRINSLNIKVYDANLDILAYDFISDSQNITVQEIK